MILFKTCENFHKLQKNQRFLISKKMRRWYARKKHLSFEHRVELWQIFFRHTTKIFSIHEILAENIQLDIFQKLKLPRIFPESNGHRFGVSSFVKTYSTSTYNITTFGVNVSHASLKQEPSVFFNSFQLIFKTPFNLTRRTVSSHVDGRWGSIQVLLGQ